MGLGPSEPRRAQADPAADCTHQLTKSSRNLCRHIMLLFRNPCSILAMRGHETRQSSMGRAGRELGNEAPPIMDTSSAYCRSASAWWLTCSSMKDAMK